MELQAIIFSKRLSKSEMKDFLKKNNIGGGNWVGEGLRSKQSRSAQRKAAERSERDSGEQRTERSVVSYVLRDSADFETLVPKKINKDVSYNLGMSGTTSSEDLMRFAHLIGLDLSVQNRENIVPKTNNIIINLDDAQGPGTHWCALKIRGDKIQYLDPIGFPPPQEVLNLAHRMKKKLFYNDEEIQDIDENYCGSYCLLFLATPNINKFYKLFGLRSTPCS